MCALTHVQVVSLEQKLRLIQTALVFLSIEIPGLLSDRGFREKNIQAIVIQENVCTFLKFSKQRF